MKIFALALFLSCSFLTNAQSFMSYVMKADSLSRVEDFKSASAAYDQAFEIGDRGFGIYYNAAYCNAQAGNLERGLELLKITVDKGCIDFDAISEDEEFAPLRKLPNWNNFAIDLKQRLS